VSDAAIHRVPGEADGFVYSLTGSQWIATGLCPRDDKVWGIVVQNAQLRRGSACWHGPFGLPPLWSRPAALRLFIH